MLRSQNDIETAARAFLSKPEWTRTSPRVAQGLPVEDRRTIGEDIKDVEFAWPLGLPRVRSLGKELWEVRSSLIHGRIARIIFCVSKGQMVLLNAFIKKTQKTPQHEIDLALKRMKG